MYKKTYSVKFDIKKPIKKTFGSNINKFLLAFTLLAGSITSLPSTQIAKFNLFAKANEVTEQTETEKTTQENKKTDERSFIEKGGYPFMIPILFMGIFSVFIYGRKYFDIQDSEVQVEEISRVFKNILNKTPEKAKEILENEFRQLKNATENKNILAKTIYQALSFIPIQSTKNKKLAIDLTIKAFEDIDKYKDSVIDIMLTDYKIERHLLGKGTKMIDIFADISTSIGFLGTLNGIIKAIPAFGAKAISAFQSSMEIAAYSSFAGLVVSLMATILYYHLEGKLTNTDFGVKIANENLEHYYNIQKNNAEK